jgi:hypothetical protein
VVAELNEQDEEGRRVLRGAGIGNSLGQFRQKWVKLPEKEHFFT